MFTRVVELQQVRKSTRTLQYLSMDQGSTHSEKARRIRGRGRIGLRHGAELVSSRLGF